MILKKSRNSVQLQTMKIVVSDTGQRPNSDMDPICRPATALVYREGGQRNKYNFFSSSKVGCDRTVIDGYSPPESNHGLTVIK